MPASKKQVHEIQSEVIQNLLSRLDRAATTYHEMSQAAHTRADEFEEGTLGHFNNQSEAEHYHRLWDRLSNAQATVTEYTGIHQEDV